MNSLDNFIKALDMVDQTPPPPPFYRLYYNKKTGNPIRYAMQEFNEDYIDITPLEYAIADINVIIKNGEIHKISTSPRSKLVPSLEGFGTSVNDITIVGQGRFWKMRTYE